MRSTIEIIGWYGAIAGLLAYVLVSFAFIPAASFSYQILNLTSALGIVANCLYKRDYQPATLNIIWSLIALIAIARLLTA